MIKTLQSLSGVQKVGCSEKWVWNKLGREYKGIQRQTKEIGG